jgi:hypothetical protein
LVEDDKSMGDIKIFGSLRVQEWDAPFYDHYVRSEGVGKIQYDMAQINTRTDEYYI